MGDNFVFLAVKVLGSQDDLTPSSERKHVLVLSQQKVGTNLESICLIARSVVLKNKERVCDTKVALELTWWNKGKSVSSEYFCYLPSGNRTQAH